MAFKQPPYQLNKDEKAVGVMAYTPTNLCWGEVIVKNHIRVGTWLRTAAAPDIVRIYNAKLLITSAPSDPPKPILFNEIHIPIQQIIAFHLLPPAQEPIDYDPTEPNRRMDPVSVTAGSFRFDGFMRMSIKSNLAKYIEVTRETYTGIYDVDIRSQVVPALGVLHTPFTLVRQNAVIFGARTT
jgi:hypothetical protein